MVTLRHGQPVVPLERLAHAVEVLRLHPEVELGAQRGAELVDDRRQVDDARGRDRRATSGLTTRPSSTRSWSITVAAPGRCTFTTTRRPSASVARCTCPMVPAASGRGSMDPNDVLPRHAELLLHHRDDLGLGHRRDRRLQRAQLLDVLGRDEVGPGREHLAELAEGGPELLERLAELLRRLLVVRPAQGAAGEPADHRGPEHPRDLPGATVEAAVVVVELAARRPGRRCSRRSPCSAARCVTRLATLPSRNSLRPRIPLLPTTRTSASTSSAAATISSAIAVTGHHARGGIRGQRLGGLGQLRRAPLTLGRRRAVGQHLGHVEPGALAAGDVGGPLHGQRPRSRCRRWRRRRRASRCSRRGSVGDRARRWVRWPDGGGHARPPFDRRSWTGWQPILSPVPSRRTTASFVGPVRPRAR